MIAWGERLLEIHISEPDFERLMIDQAISDSTGTLQMHRAPQRGLNFRILLAVYAHGMRIRMFITTGSVAKCSQVNKLIEGRDAEYLLADNGYDGDALVGSGEPGGINLIMPPHKSGKTLCCYG